MQTLADTPPPYAQMPVPSPATPVPSASTPPAPRAPHQQQELYRPPPNQQAQNHVFIQQQNTGIKGTYVIDTHLFVPPDLVDPGLDARGDAVKDGDAAVLGVPNLKLDSYNGSVTADVWLLHENAASSPLPEAKDDRAILDLKSYNGSVTAKIVRLLHPSILSS